MPDLVVVTCTIDGTVRAVGPDKESTEQAIARHPKCPTCALKAEFDEKLKALEQRMNERFAKVASYAGRQF